MTLTEKLKWRILPALLIIGIGLLEIQFPDVMHDFDDGYTGRGGAGLILLLVELFLWLTWGTIGGVITIALGILIIINCLAPNNKQTEISKPVRTNFPQTSKTGNDQSFTNDDQQSMRHAITSLAFRAGKTYVQRKLRGRQS